jgi:hypothetical protein
LVSSISISRHVTQNQNEQNVNATGVHLWLVLWKAARALETHPRQSIEMGDMCRSDFGVLEALLHKGPLPVNILARQKSFSRADLSRPQLTDWSAAGLSSGAVTQPTAALALFI